MTTHAPQILICSFCGKKKDEVKKLVAGPDVYICDRCVDLAREALDDEDPSTKVDKEVDLDFGYVYGHVLGEREEIEKFVNEISRYLDEKKIQHKFEAYVSKDGNIFTNDCDKYDFQGSSRITVGHFMTLC